MKEFNIMKDEAKCGTVVVIFKNGEKIADFVHYHMPLINEITDILEEIPIVDCAYVGFNPTWYIDVLNVFLA